jgi:hypothetical protein
MWVVVSVVALVVLLATYVTWTAARVDRLHVRATAATAALETQSLRRAACAQEVALRAGLDDLQLAAKAVLASGDEPVEERTATENALTRALRSAHDVLEAVDATAVAEASRRLALARALHADTVRDARAVRRHPIARLLRLASDHARPDFFDIDDPSL